jgi:transcription elongation factor GreA
MPRIYTKEGIEKLETELGERKGVLRQEIATAIKEAKEQGDLSENAEYSDAKARQNENESRVLELEAWLKDAVVTKKHRASDTVEIGSQLVVKVSGKELQFVIVGSNEADPATGKISNESPLGKEFMGKKAGGKVEIDAPAGKLKYEIVSVK